MNNGKRILLRIAVSATVLGLMLVASTGVCLGAPPARTIALETVSPSSFATEGIPATLPVNWIEDRPVKFYQATVTTSAVYQDQVRWWEGNPWRVDGLVRNDTGIPLSHCPVFISWLAADGTILRMDVTFVVILELKPGQAAGFTTDIDAPPAGTTNVDIEAFGREAVSPATDLALESWTLTMPPAVTNNTYTLTWRNDSTQTVVMPSYGVPEFCVNVGKNRFMDYTWDIWNDVSIPASGTWSTTIGGGMNWSVFSSGDTVTGTIYAQARQPVETTRIAGIDRYETAVKACRSAFPTASAVVVASGENFPDALAGAGLAGAYDAPLLLTRKGTLYSGIPGEIDPPRRDPRDHPGRDRRGERLGRVRARARGGGYDTAGRG